MYPSEEILESLPSIVNLLLINPVPNSILFFRVLKEPIVLLVNAYALLLSPSVFRFIVAPKAEAPFVEDPTPR